MFLQDCSCGAAVPLWGDSLVMQHKQWVKTWQLRGEQHDVRICRMNHSNAADKQREIPQVHDNIWSKHLAREIRFVTWQKRRGAPTGWWLTRCYKRVFTWLVVCGQDLLLPLMRADAADGLRDAGMTGKLDWNDRAGRRRGFHWLVSVKKWETTAVKSSSWGEMYTFLHIWSLVCHYFE